MNDLILTVLLPEYEGLDLHSKMLYLPELAFKMLILPGEKPVRNPRWVPLGGIEDWFMVWDERAIYRE